MLLILQNRCFKQEWPQKNTWISYNIGPRRRNSDFRLRLGLSRIYQMKIWVDNVVESYKEISSVDGKLYSLPLAANTMGVAYNKTMFSENNWDIPTTWAEFISLCGNHGYQQGSLRLYFQMVIRTRFPKNGI